jgi:hypothetical protein
MGGKHKHIFLLFFIAIEAFLLIKLIVPFMLYNNLNIQDTVGHYFTALYTKSQIWPDFMGWNPYHFMGYAPLQFYAPLFTIFTILFSYLMPLKLAFKAVLGLSVLAAPLSFYYFSRKIGFDEFKASIAMLSMTSALFFLRDYVGGTVYSTFNAGLVANALALPLMFFYLGKLNESFKTKKYAWPSVLMALIVLSHMFTAIIAAIASFCFFIASLDKSKKEKIIFYAKHVGLTFLLSSFWFVPMLAKLGYSGTVYMGPQISRFWVYYIVFFIFLAFAMFYQKNVKQVSISLIALIVIFILGEFVHLPFHFYRMQLFLLLFIIVILVSVLKSKISYAIASVFFILLIISNLSNIFPEGMPDISIKDFGKVDGRVLVLNHADNKIGWHTLPYKISMVTGNKIVQGLNIDSAENGFLIGDFIKTIDKDAYIMYSDMFPMYDYDKNASLIPQQLALFDINYIVSENLSFGKKVIGGVYENYSLYRVSDSKFAEVLDYRPIVVKENFKENAFRWFFEDCSKILVNDDVPDSVGLGSEKVTVVKETPKEIILNVDSNSTVPVLVKMSYFPNWKAYSGGKEVKVYKASPNLVLVYGQGEMILRYEKVWADWVGIGLSAVGISLFLFLKE